MPIIVVCSYAMKKGNDTRAAGRGRHVTTMATQHIPAQQGGGRKSGLKVWGDLSSPAKFKGGARTPARLLRERGRDRRR
jgi:hypothetical protein